MRGANEKVSFTDGEVSEEDIAEEEATHRVIPRVRPLTSDELDVSPPAKQEYRVPMRRALGELFRARELLYTFVERDLKVRYKQAVLGGLWAILQPIVVMVIFTAVFGRIAQVGSEGLPYPIFVYCALVPWGLFSGSVGYGTNAVISNSGIIRKIYCPREVFALSSVASATFDFAISSVILLGMLLAFGIYPAVSWVAYPLLLFALLVYTLFLTMIVSAITVYFRDTRYVIPMMLQILLFATPVAYPLSKATSAFPEWLAEAYPYLNPLVPIIDGFRRVLAHGTWPDWGPLGSAVAIGTIALVLTYRWYKRIDGTFADVI
jgi:ABC-type polysaccharide/polyol phosphate export permease